MIPSIEIAIVSNFWPSGRGTAIVSLQGPLVRIAEILNAPIFVVDGEECILVCARNIGPVSIYSEKATGYLLVVVDDALDLNVAKNELINEFSDRLNFLWS